MKKHTLFIIIAAIIAVAAGIFAQQFIAKPPPPATPVIPAYSSPLTTKLPDLSGRIQWLSQWQGKILIINFWATWCPSCLTEIPEFITLQKQYSDKNVQFIGIALEDKQAVIAYNATAKINYPILIAGDNGIAISKAWGNMLSSVPFTVVLNPQGDIIYRQLGEINREKLLEVIQPLLNLRMI